jgi:VCBS repeat-containing protein
VRCLALCFVAIVISFLPASSTRSVCGADDGVRLTLKADSLEVTVGGELFTTYHFAKTQKKPYFWPIRDQEGKIITRPLLTPEGRPWRDHPHHRGLWFAVDEVNGVKFWAERGTIANVSVDPIVPVGNPARFKVVNHWLDKQGQPLLKESTTISVYANRLIAYDATLAAVKEPVTFADTKEGLFGFRLADSIRGSAGKIVSADGHHGEGECWGKTFDWVDYDGPVDGKTVGVAIFDNPHNFRPSRYHVRSYGLFSISPFGEHDYTNKKSPAKPVHLAPGANLRLRYAIYVHDGDTKVADVAGVYRKYIAESGE